MCQISLDPAGLQMPLEVVKAVEVGRRGWTNHDQLYDGVIHSRLFVLSLLNPVEAQLSFNGARQDSFIYCRSCMLI